MSDITRVIPAPGGDLVGVECPDCGCEFVEDLAEEPPFECICPACGHKFTVTEVER